MHSQVMKISPALAETWLEANTFNRTISRHTVERYTADMKNGSWRLNHQGIAFDDSGTLVDGQQRLTAIIKSGATVEMMETWGADRVGIDELRSRSTADVVKFGGLSNWAERKHLECAKQMITLTTKDSKSVAIKPSTIQLVEFADKNKDAIEFSESLFSSHEKGISTAGTRGVIATAYYHFSKDDLVEFCDTLYTGIVTSPDRSAVIRAREMLKAGGFSGGGASRIQAAWKLMRAIKAFSERQQLARLMSQSSPAFTLPEDRQ